MQGTCYYTDSGLLHSGHMCTNETPHGRLFLVHKCYTCVHVGSAVQSWSRHSFVFLCVMVGDLTFLTRCSNVQFAWCNRDSIHISTTHSVLFKELNNSASRDVKESTQTSCLHPTLCISISLLKSDM